MPESRIFLDYNSTAPLHPKAKEAMLEVMDCIGNPSSIHSFGRQMRQRFEQARQRVNEILGVDRHDALIFNSGGSEGNNTVIKTFLNAGGTVFASSIEHPCILEVSSKIKKIPVTKTGVIQLEWLEESLSSFVPEGPVLISVMLANNETGTIQPLQEVISLAKKHGAYVHSDMVQAIGRIPVCLDRYPVDYLTLSSHKVGGPVGIGALYVHSKAPYSSLIVGGAQEKSRRAGTLNVMGAVGFEQALSATLEEDWEAVAQKRNFLEQKIISSCPQAHVWGQTEERLPNTSSLHMPGVNNETQVIAFDLEGIAVSAGSACSSGKISRSHVLEAMGISEKEAQETIRLSLGPTLNQRAINKFIETWIKIYQKATSPYRNVILLQQSGETCQNKIIHHA